jgi:queuine tRNA-ribosyltransferase
MMEEIRGAIEEQRYAEYKKNKLNGFAQGEE